MHFFSFPLKVKKRQIYIFRFLDAVHFSVLYRKEGCVLSGLIEKLTLTQLSMSDMWFSICKRKKNHG